MTQIYHTWDTWVRVGYPPSGSKLCTACGGAQSEPGDWTNLTIHPGIPLSVTGAVTMFSGSRPNMSWTFWEGGGG